MKYGIATKLSKINNDYSKLLELNKIISSNFDYHVIDAELLPITDENILKSKSKKLVLTVQSKRKNAFELLELYSSYNVDICVVLGSNFYLTNEKPKPKDVILKVIDRALDICNNKIWVGTEGVEDIVKNIVEENDLIAYYVYGGKFPDYDSKKAVYVPYTEKIDRNTLDTMENYLKRRKNYIGNYEDFILSLNNHVKIKELKNKNDIIIGYPINNNNIFNFKKYFNF
ncbi:hypothetical protein [Methanothermococcus okinawensis]|uniref:Uncharacterized protein n=1 Tax=Methanothermococcus okinawensis (strain DSM 14208 / JCM 11175 / IH1) TaxID=647113 RepID=F8AMA2_METOI|nr:hypothetical protein [Methanothermococcus okinawensis]AEH06792.1 hypothetical protein Metok_0815 [Methanothermococcus okinawensis IH1]